MILLAAGKLKPEHPQLSKKIHVNRKRAGLRNPLTLCRYTDIIIKEEGLKSHSGLIDCLWGNSTEA